MMLDKPSIPKNGLMNAEEYKESLREYSPVVYIDGEKIKSVADEPRLTPGINAVGITYEYAQRLEFGKLM